MKHQRFSLLVISIAVLSLIAVIFFVNDSHTGLSVFVKYLFSVLVLFAEGILLIWSVYQATISVAGFFRLNEESGKLVKYPRILCLTAAHNEAKVIAEHVKNLQAVHYPKSHYDIVVLADNCTDETAKISRRLGATVWERRDLSERGKGYALRWALHSRADLKKYDAVCIFDADNLVHPDFLMVMAKHVARGDMAIQGYLDTKNPNDNWISLSYASMYWFMNRFWQRARSVLHLSATLGGTGFCLSTKLLRTLPFQAINLTEDLEYTARLALAGHKVVFSSAARVFDEKPLQYEASVLQRMRWMQGHWMTAIRYVGPLLRKTCSSRTERICALDLSIYLLQPVFLLLMGFNFIVSMLQLVFGSSWYFPWLTNMIPSPVWTILSIVGFCYPLTAFVLERASWKAFLYYPLYLLFNLTWIPVGIEALYRRHQREWVHTKHQRAISIEELEQRKLKQFY